MNLHHDLFTQIQMAPLMKFSEIFPKMFNIWIVIFHLPQYMLYWLYGNVVPVLT
jgi:hypothetical protein